MRNLLIVISGPSGVGKGTVVRKLVPRGNYSLSVSYTTRGPRPGEQEGKSYYYIGREQFEKLIKEDGLLEYDEHFGSYYGTPRAFVEEKLKQSDVILEIDVRGGKNVKKRYPEALMIFLLPPSREELKRRLLKRDTENIAKVEERLSRLNYELGQLKYYDYFVVNDDLNTAIMEIEKIIKSNKGEKND